MVGFELHCFGTIKKGKYKGTRCNALLGVFDALEGDFTTVCRKCGEPLNFRFAKIHGVQFVNGERPIKRL